MAAAVSVGQPDYDTTRGGTGAMARWIVVVQSSLQKGWGANDCVMEMPSAGQDAVVRSSSSRSAASVNSKPPPLLPVTTASEQACHASATTTAR